MLEVKFGVCLLGYRLRRRIETYRRRQTECMPRFDQSFNGLCEQNHQDTQVLKQRYLEPKAKRPNKPKDKKQQDTISSSVHVVSTYQCLLLFYEKVIYL